MLDLCWPWKEKWWALWFQLLRRLRRKITGAQEFLVIIVRASLLKETNRCCIRNSSHLPLWVPRDWARVVELAQPTQPCLWSPARFIVSILWCASSSFVGIVSILHMKLWSGKMSLQKDWPLSSLRTAGEDWVWVLLMPLCLNHCLLMFAVTSTALREWSILLPRHLSHKDDDWSCDPPILSRGNI